MSRAPPPGGEGKSREKGCRLTREDRPTIATATWCWERWRRRCTKLATKRTMRV
jgi:hypothetical protein